MHLKRFTDLGLRILMHLANEADPETPHSVPELSRFLCWNQNLVIKTANAMVKAGWLSAVRGRHGGLRLACKPEDLRIGDVVRTLEDNDIARRLQRAALSLCRQMRADRCARQSPGSLLQGTQPIHARRSPPQRTGEWRFEPDVLEGANHSRRAGRRPGRVRTPDGTGLSQAASMRRTPGRRCRRRASVARF